MKDGEIESLLFLGFISASWVQAKHYKTLLEIVISKDICELDKLMTPWLSVNFVGLFRWPIKTCFHSALSCFEMSALKKKIFYIP